MHHHNYTPKVKMSNGKIREALGIALGCILLLTSIAGFFDVLVK